jgi:hypothetical protein
MFCLLDETPEERQCRLDAKKIQTEIVLANKSSEERCKRLDHKKQGHLMH